MSSFRIAHISDLHFSHITFHCKQFFSKRWVGNANLLLRRKKDFRYSLLDELIPLFLNKKVDTVLVSGDLTCTSSEEEFLLATLFIQRLQKEGFSTIVLPGNHDHYTKTAYKKKVFYHFFPSTAKEDRIHIEQLSDQWWVVALDTSLATPLFCCHGVFEESLERRLEATLTDLPSEAKVILANHFPLPISQDLSLQRGKQLEALLQRHPKVKLYLHGHTHKNRIIDRRNLQLPIMVDAGSASHRFTGGWNLIQCSDLESSIQPFLWQTKEWVPQHPHHFIW